jgi:hypothetical protein
MFEGYSSQSPEAGLSTGIPGVIDGTALIVKKRSIHRVVSGGGDAVGFGVDYEEAGFVFVSVVFLIIVYFYSRFEIFPG